MRKKLTSLFISAMTLSNLNLSINYSVAMEKEDKDVIDFASRLSDPNSTTFTESIEKIIGSKDIEKHFLQYIMSTSDSLQKQALLAVCKLFQLHGHTTIVLDFPSLFQIFSEGCETYQKSTVLTHCLAFCFSQGIGTKTDSEKAIELYEIAIQGGFSYSFYNLANMYQQENNQKAIELYETVIEKGQLNEKTQAKAMYNLAYAYLNGEGIEKTIQKAIQLYEKVIEMGNKNAIHDLASIYLTGNAVEKNISKAIQLYEKAIEMGDADAMNNLACIYLMGNGVEKNIPKAIQLYEKAIEKGQLNEKLQASAMYNLSCAYLKAEGEERNIPKAIELLEKAIEMRNELAMSALARLYLLGNYVKKDTQKAVELLEKAVEMGQTTAMNELAYLYQKGMGVKKNISKTIQLHEKAIEKGHAVSMNDLAYLYLKGEDVDKNIPKAIELFEKAIKKGEIKSMSSLAYIYEKGDGVEKNIPKAIQLYEKMFKMGDITSMNNLACLYLEESTEKNIPKAIQLYEKAIEMGCIGAMNNLAFMCQEGKIIPKNLEKAQELYEKSFLLGDRRCLPSFLCKHDKEDRLIEVEVEHANLFPDFSIEFSDMITSGAMSNKKRIQSTIEFLIQKKYKEYFLNESKYPILKDKRKSMRDIKIIPQELTVLRANFMNKMKENRLTAFVDVREIKAILFPKDKEIKGFIDFTSCLNKPNEIDTILASRDIQKRLFEFIMSPSSDDLPYKKTLLTFYKIFELPGHTSIDLTPDALFHIVSESFQTNQENAVLNYCLAKCFQDGIGTKKNSSEAIRMHEIAIQKGFTYSLIDLGEMYLNDMNIYDVEKNYQKALDLILKAIDLKKPRAIRTLASMYFRGYGVKRNLHTALKLYQKAADLGESNAIKSLGALYIRGSGVMKDDKKAFKLFKKGHELENTKATLSLAYSYENGVGVEKNTEKAIKLCNQLINNDTDAMIYLASICPEKALDLYKQAIKLENTEAIVSLADSYKNGKGVEKDIGKAVELYQEAVDLKNTNAMCKLALLYLKGEGAQKDIEKAVELYQEAVDLKNTNAMCELGLLYLNGNEIKKDTEKALTLFNKAIKLGDTSAINYLAIMYARGDGLQKDIEKTKKLFKEACELGNLSYAETLIKFYKETGASEDKNLLEIYKIFFAEGSEKQKKYLPQFLCENNQVGKLFKLTYKYPELLPSFFSELLPHIKLSSKNILIEATLKSFIRRQYSKNLSIFSDPKKYNFLKIKKLFEYKTLPPFLSANKDSLLAQLPKYLVLLIANNLSPRSLIALASTSKHLYHVLYERIGDIDIITQELLRLDLAFTSKLTKASIERAISLGKIIDILEKK